MQILNNYDLYDYYDYDLEDEETCWSPEAISQMHNLKILRIDGISQMHNLKFLRIDGTFHVPQHLPNSLRVLSWSHYPSNSLPSR